MRCRQKACEEVVAMQAKCLVNKLTHLSKADRQAQRHSSSTVGWPTVNKLAHRFRPALAQARQTCMQQSYFIGLDKNDSNNFKKPKFKSRFVASFVFLVSNNASIDVVTLFGQLKISSDF